MARIYVSSTFTDLQEERQMAQLAIRTLDHLPVAMETYTASEERPLDRCLADVRSCQGYVGIFAWRYGYVPPSHQKSITHLEYEEAGSQQIPRLIFLLDERVDWPAERRENDPRLLQLRQHLGIHHLTARFRSLDDLKAQVVAAVARTFGTGHVIPELLPYLMDRSRQEDEIAQALQSQPSSRPLLLIIHGDEVECHEKFVDRLVAKILPQLLGASAKQNGVTSYDLDWPAQAQSFEEFDRRLRASLGERVLGQRSASLEEVQKYLALHPGPVVLQTYVLAPELRRLGTGLIDTFARFFDRWPVLDPCQRLVVTLSVKYIVQESSGWLARLGLGWQQKDLEELLDEEHRQPGKLPAVVLSRLEGIERGDVENWARAETPKYLKRDGDHLLPEIRAIYTRWQSEQKADAIPMESLAKELSHLLHGRSGKQEGFA